MDERTFNLTPDPKVLIALTRTPLKPLDALCELIDNALDGFRIAEIHGTGPSDAYITIDIPGPAEVRKGSGVLRVRDNGPGMPPAVAEQALRAGFSSNNPFDSLGLFGMGFNISTGKLGRRTVFRTKQRADADQLEVRIDLEEIQNSGTYDVPVAFSPPADGMEHGTVVEVSRWWPNGDMNHGFTTKLAQERSRLRDLIGRRYASILRDGKIRIAINGEQCGAFEHCVWAGTRYVERSGHGQIPARFEFDERVGSQQRCSACFTLAEDGRAACQACGGQSFRTVEQKVQGWVGVQRYDDETDFGIDLIRNGRAIRVAEKSAFFDFADELGALTKDYPIDQQYGRIVGEVHLDHVPVDFQKQDFQRSTTEWEQAVKYLRGSSSLQPNKPGASTNTSPVFKLYQGYRKVRNVGRRDMYMGQWEAGAEKPRRVSRATELEYYGRFQNREPGFHGDDEWWKLVEAAEARPVEDLAACPQCGIDNLKSAEICDGCAYPLIGHECHDCGKRVPASARTCPYCAAGQKPEDTNPWNCNVCGSDNGHVADVCAHCEFPRGTPNLASKEYLVGRAQLDDGLSIDSCTIGLADGSSSQPLNIRVYRVADHITPAWGGTPVPLAVFKDAGLDVFVDVRHEVLATLATPVEVLVATEVAHYWYLQHQRLAATAGPMHSVSTLTGAIVAKYYRERLDLSDDSLRDAMGSLMAALRRRLAEGLPKDASEDIFAELPEADHKAFAQNLVGSGRSVTEVAAVVATGEFIDFLDEPGLVGLFVRHPGAAMEAWPEAGGAIPTGVAEELAREQLQELTRALEDCVAYRRVVNPSEALTRKAKASLDYLAVRLDL